MNSHKIWSFLGLMTKEDKKNMDSSIERLQNTLDDIQKSISLIQEQDKKSIAEMKEYRELLENRFESTSNLNMEGFNKLEKAYNQITKLINGASKNIDNNGEQVNVNLDIIQELLKLLVVNELIEYVPKRK